MPGAMILPAAFFVYGLAAGFLVIRLRGRRRRGRGVEALGWLMTGLSFALAIGLLVWDMVGAG